ncbi:MAG TPA: hypothetical protein VFN19_04090 [Candidatus Nanopelagicales bacterium]|nr:hypothetical protein [Candidatus Nanopelagicales bacterium]
MALIHTDADLNPGKLELIAAWLPTQPWGASGEATRLASYRFDDPAGEVGIETFVVAVGDAVLQVPMTYRGTPLEGARPVGEMEHSVLGHRYVYDGATDPVYLDAVRQVVVAGGHEADWVTPDGTVLPRFRTSAAVSGLATDPAAAAGTVEVVRRPLEDDAVSDADVVGTLTGTWTGQEQPIVLVRLRRG